MKKEIGTWLNLESSPTEEEAMYAKAFLDLPDSMFFLAAIDENPIGGTAIYRDRTRLAMTLVAAKLENKYKENTPLQLFKASLPFFKTPSIRDVDVLVEETPERSNIPFPINSKLQSWVRPALEKMRFEEVAKVGEVNLHGGEQVEIQNPITMDKQPNHEAARKLLWDQRKEIGLSCSQQWLALDMANARGTLRTYTIQDGICMAVGVEKLSHQNVITFFVTNPEILSTSVAAELFRQNLTEDRVTFSLVGDGQMEIVRAVSSLRGSILSMNELTLLRKLL